MPPADRAAVERALGRAFTGQEIHVGPGQALEGLDWERAGHRPYGASHSIYQVVNHLAYWQDWALEWLDGDDPPVPEHAADGWPEGESPRNRGEWDEAVTRFSRGQATLRDRLAAPDLLERRRGDRSALEVLQAIASHNSYHLGQVVVLRQLLGAWPPPGGGLTW